MSLPPVTTWHVHEQEIRIYRDGELVASIPRSQFGNLIYAMAAVMR